MPWCALALAPRPTATHLLSLARAAIGTSDTLGMSAKPHWTGNLTRACEFRTHGLLRGPIFNVGAGIPQRRPRQLCAILCSIHRLTSTGHTSSKSLSSSGAARPYASLTLNSSLGRHVIYANLSSPGQPPLPAARSSRLLRQRLSSLRPVYAPSQRDVLAAKTPWWL